MRAQIKSKEKYPSSESSQSEKVSNFGKDDLANQNTRNDNDFEENWDTHDTAPKPFIFDIDDEKQGKITK